MGQTQFIPSAYLSTAVDGDGDGKRDIWASPRRRPGLGRQPAGQGRLAARPELGARGHRARRTSTSP